ncbi:MAG: class I SAM-dependent methyltransferase [Heyndrickxia sp.]
MIKELKDYTTTYINDKMSNDRIYIEFTNKTNEIPFLKKHRDHIEKNNLGFGERAFQYMWFLLVKDVYNRKGNNIKALEIGVFKGQIISLWKLIEKNLNINIDVTGITPLEGNPKSNNKLLHKIKSFLSKKYINDINAGNHYDNLDYLSIIKNLFYNFELDFTSVNIIKGYSNNLEIRNAIEDERYDIVYIDGDHSYEGATFDIINYSKQLKKDGFLVVDDASCNIPGSVFWKGHQSVSDACKHIDTSKFKNILNVGHNRIFQKL